MAANYMTVGEVADLVGVTVRSIQYYDQQGVLCPSAKGPQNQRFYTPQDVERLYCILSLKYAGLSLAQIRELLKDGAQVSRPQAYEIFMSALRETEGAFSSLLSRYATLRSLAEAVEPADAAPLAGMPGFAALVAMPSSNPSSSFAQADGDAPSFSDPTDTPCAPQDAQPADVDWRALSSFTRRLEGEGKYFWRLSCIYGEDVPRPDADHDHRQAVTEWHSLIAHIMSLASSQEPLDSARSQGVVRRYLKLHGQDGAQLSGNKFLLLEGAPANHPGGASFDGMRQKVYEHLSKLLARYAELHPDEDVPPIDGGGAE